MGNVLGKLGRYTEAISASKSAIAITPDDADAYYAYYTMGLTLELLDRHEEAIAAYQRAASLDPDGYFGEDARHNIRILRKR